MASLKELRFTRGFVQRDLATLLQVKPSTISNWENGICQPSMANRLKMKKKLGLSLEEILRMFPLDPPQSA
jgi:transcriptional regulator with XRE-family HTH domain